MKTYYAQQSPRGFGNEINTYQFSTRDARNQWVDAHANDGDVNSASCGARACTAKEARATVQYKGDATTKSYNSTLIDGDAVLRREGR